MKKHTWKKIGIITVVGLLACAVAFHAFSLEAIMPEILGITVPLLAPSVPLLAGPAGGLIYAVTQTPQHIKSDTRQWTQSQSHRTQIRSWVLELRRARGTALPSIVMPGFCTQVAAMEYALRAYPQLYPQVTPNPMPCTHPRGFGAWGSPR